MEKLTYKQLGKLIEQAQQGDMDAFAKFYAATYKGQYYSALTTLKDSTKAEDATQETYRYLLEHLQNIRNPEMAVSYLNKANRSACMEIVRKEKRATSTDFDELAPFLKDENPTPADQMNKKTENELIRMSLSTLEKPLSDVLVMRFVQEMKIVDIADSMQVSPRTVKRYIKKGAQEMRKALEKLKDKVMSLSFFAIPYVANLLRKSTDQSITPEKGQEILNRVLPATSSSTVTLAALGSLGIAATSLGAKVGLGLLLAGGVSVLGAGVVLEPNITVIPMEQGFTSSTVEVQVENHNPLLMTSIIVYNEDGNVYLSGGTGNPAILQIADNGTYRLQVETINGKSFTSSFQISTIDHSCPVLTTPVYNETQATFVITDTGSGVDYTSLELTDTSGNPMDFEVDPTSGVVTYSSAYSPVNVYSRDLVGNETYSTIENK